MVHLCNASRCAPFHPPSPGLFELDREGLRVSSLKQQSEANLNTHMYTIGTAAKTTGFSKATISRAIKNGQMSARRLDDKSYAIDPAELQRWIESNSHRNSNLKRIATQDETPVTPSSDDAFQAEIEGLRALAEERQRTIDDLRRRLDQEAEERRKLTAMLTDQRAQPAPPKGGLLARLFGGK